ncbi:autoantigen p27 domain-containing protein [Methanomicrobium antiquum]|uniref:Autoantigen p27 domain-containing protein n=1 Tax=Methanomicrobium antiquum TaxID=487686 RepID=A0AAF0FPE7_9EURY|nr:Sjogren's syndrome/scleroderma autoantigen 1 family protein [Methanomicrobium antiquum]WFN36062.1 autoantigen p27 domain-containing protein [Methanomicrobium antiquum]
MKNPEDIMADYLLKGAKMLDKSCPECGLPLFNVKGETYCVVCRDYENKNTSAPAPNKNQALKSVVETEETKKTENVTYKKEPKDAEDISSQELKSVSKEKSGSAPHQRYVFDEILYNEISDAISALCRRIETEKEPRDCLCLMKSVNSGIDALKKLESYKKRL